MEDVDPRLALIQLSPEDADLLEREFRIHNGYPNLRGPSMGRRRELHWIIGHLRMGLPSSRSCQIDHVNRDKLDCRRENLRSLSARGNQLNSDRVERACRIQPCGKRWVAQIDIAGKTHHLGMFATAEEAAKVYRDPREAGEPLAQPRRVKGYTFHKRQRKWQAQAKKHGKSVFIGLFKTEAEAAAAYHAYCASTQEAA